MLSISFTYYITNYVILPRQNESLDATFFLLLKFLLKVWTLNNYFEKSIAVNFPEDFVQDYRLK